VLKVSNTDSISEDLAGLLADADAVRALRGRLNQATRQHDQALDTDHSLSETIASAITHEAADLVQKKVAEFTQFDDLNQQIEHLTKEIERAAKAHPAVALLAAGALGFALAHLINKS